MDGYNTATSVIGDTASAIMVGEYVAEALVVLMTAVAAIVAIKFSLFVIRVGMSWVSLAFDLRRDDNGGLSDAEVDEMWANSEPAVSFSSRSTDEDRALLDECNENGNAVMAAQSGLCPKCGGEGVIGTRPSGGSGVVVFCRACSYQRTLAKEDAFDLIPF